MTCSVALVRGRADGRTLAASDGELARAIAPAHAGDRSGRRPAVKITVA
jgi:hypothetical protein